MRTVRLVGQMRDPLSGESKPVEIIGELQQLELDLLPRGATDPRFDPLSDPLDDPFPEER